MGKIFGEVSENGQRVAKAFVCGYVKRILYPGCHWPVMVGLCGSQGIGKTSMAYWLAGEHGSVHNLGVDDFRYISKDTKLGVLRSNVVVLDDITDLGKGEVTTLKNMITLTADKVRESYGRTEMVWKRKGIMMCTSNERYIIPMDTTGNRRYAAVWSEELAPLDWLNEWRLQILYEAREEVVDGGGAEYKDDIDFSLMAEFEDKTELYRGVEEFVDALKAGEKQARALCLPVGKDGVLWFRARAYWLWAGVTRDIRDAEFKLIRGYFEAQGVIYKDKKAIRVDGKLIGNVYKLTCP